MRWQDVYTWWSQHNNWNLVFLQKTECAATGPKAVFLGNAIIFDTKTTDMVEHSVQTFWIIFFQTLDRK